MTSWWFLHVNNILCYKLWEPTIVWSDESSASLTHPIAVIFLFLFCYGVVDFGDLEVTLEPRVDNSDLNGFAN